MALLRSRVVRDAHPGKRCELLAAQARHAAAPAIDQADVRGSQLLTA